MKSSKSINVVLLVWQGTQNLLLEECFFWNILCNMYEVFSHLEALSPGEEDLD